jgi:hypothetical protein
MFSDFFRDPSNIWTLFILITGVSYFYIRQPFQFVSLTLSMGVVVLCFFAGVEYRNFVKMPWFYGLGILGLAMFGGGLKYFVQYRGDVDHAVALRRETEG